MNTLTKILFLLLVVTFCPQFALASTANVYIAQTAAGAANGTSCANAYVYTFFNNSSNWPGTIGPGTTVTLCGTFTAAAGSTLLTFQGSGTSGNPITLQAASTGATLTAPYWSSNGAINLNGNSYLVIDGYMPCGYNDASDGVCNGVIQATLNGSSGGSCPGGPCQYQQTTVGINASNTTNVEVKNWGIINLYMHTTVNDNDEADHTLIQAVDYYPQSNNMTVDHNFIHDCGWCLNGYGNNLLVYNNEIYNMDHGLAVGNNNSGNILSNIKIHDNHIHDMANWDTTSGSDHHDGIHMWAQTSGSGPGPNPGQINGSAIYNNLFDGDMGLTHTGWVYLEDNVSTTSIYNNVFKNIAGRILNNGMAEFDGKTGDTSVSGNSMYNNVALDNNPTAGGDSCYAAIGTFIFNFENNISQGCNTVLTLYNSATVGTINYNVYDNSCTNGNCFGWQGNNTGSLATWQSECGCDGNSQFVTPAQINVNSAGSPASGSVTIGTGTNLTSLCGTLNGLCIDKVGTARPATGAWTAGAYQVNATSGIPPANLLTGGAQILGTGKVR